MDSFELRLWDDWAGLRGSAFPLVPGYGLPSNFYGPPVALDGGWFRPRLPEDLCCRPHFFGTMD